MTTKKLREETGMPAAMCANAWKESGENWELAMLLLKQKGAQKSSTLNGRNADAVCVGVYQHHDKTRAGVVKMRCETDFVAKTKEFQSLAYNIAVHVCASECDSVEELLAQYFVVPDIAETIGEMIQSLSAKTGEKIEIEKFFQV